MALQRVALLGLQLLVASKNHCSVIVSGMAAAQEVEQSSAELRVDRCAIEKPLM